MARLKAKIAAMTEEEFDGRCKELLDLPNTLGNVLEREIVVGHML
jgi:hypothetical protein